MADMTPISQVARLLSVAMICGAIGCMTLVSPTQAQCASSSAVATSPAPHLIRQMVGTWSVRQRMWPGPSAAAIDLPPAIARRQLIEGAFLQEVMEPARKSAKDRFTRTAYFNFNAVTQQYEYFSLDSRAPQMMNEKSHEPLEQSKQNDKGAIKLYGGSFVAPRWGDSTNVAFTYRLTVGEIEKERQVVQLHLTPQAEEGAKEFLAFEYIYTRQR
jgi:Protein of unknown function (DUF1579)